MRWYNHGELPTACTERQEQPMNHISLDSQDEAVKRFVLSLPADPQGSILELGGQPIVCVLPASMVSMNDNGADGPWTEAKNARRLRVDRPGDRR